MVSLFSIFLFFYILLSVYVYRYVSPGIIFLSSLVRACVSAQPHFFFFYPPFRGCTGMSALAKAFSVFFFNSLFSMYVHMLYMCMCGWVRAHIYMHAEHACARVQIYMHACACALVYVHVRVKRDVFFFFGY